MVLNMHVLFIFVGFHCIHNAWLQACIPTETEYFCKAIPTDYPAGLTSLIIFVGSLGEVSLSMFNSSNLTSVNSLTMTHQGITAIRPWTFNKFQNLKTLNLDTNDLSQVSSDWFSHQDMLETLKLSNNKITALDHYSFNGLSNLLMLDLSQNQIYSITMSSFLNLSKLRQLDLSNNKLTHLNPHVFLPLNGTKIRLDGNPWNCSCSVKDFAKYLRGLKNASLLENEMQVFCDRPPELKGVPVWQVPECKTLTTWSPSTAALGNTTGNPATENLVTILPKKPLTIKHSTLIILIVVLCALVLVICVLSVLYHRKREKHHLQTVRPSETSQIIHASERTVKSNCEENRKMKSATEFATTEFLLRTNQMVAGNERISQIYHIYSSGISETREPIKRVRSAGAVLCRVHMLAKMTETETAAEENGLRNNDYYNRCMTKQDKESVNIEDTEKVQDNINITDEVEKGFTLEFCNTTGTLETDKKRTRQTNEDDDESIKTRTNVYKDVPQCGLENDVFDHIDGLTLEAGSTQDIPQVKNVMPHFEENAENLPYFSIGADPENQRSGGDPNTSKGVSEHLRPIQRVLTWPPTAVQWKKQWAQNQQVINVFPKLIFVTGCMQEVRPFHPSISPLIFPTSPQFSALEFLPEIMSPVEDIRVAIDEDGYKASLESCTQKVLHFSPLECFPNVNISPNEDNRVNLNGETWRSGLESTIDVQDLSSKNSPIDESEVCSELFNIFNPSFGGSKSKSAMGEEMVNKNNMEETQSVKKKRHKVRQVRSELLNQSERAERAAPKSSRDRWQGQVCNSSDLRAPTSGGSPKDDSLLLGNEYTFIDLLHEVVENNGRWTRERWRQTQKNKHKHKQGPSH